MDVERRAKLGFLKNSAAETRRKHEGRMYHRILKGPFQTLTFRQDFLIRLSEGDRIKKIVVIMMIILMIKYVQ
jgi:hypothetical protein